jgi:hypothetical protein
MKPKPTIRKIGLAVDESLDRTLPYKGSGKCESQLHLLIAVLCSYAQVRI